MAIFTKDNAGNNFVLGTSSADIILLPFGPFGDTGAVSAGAGIDELRFSSVVNGDFLVIADNMLGIESVVIGTGIGAVAVTSGTTALDIDASESVNALALVGNSGANLILGTLFADTITGGAGADQLYGGAGNDSFIVASAAHHSLGELIDGEGGFDTLVFTCTIAGDTLVMRADDDVEAIVIGNGAALTTGTLALHVDASGMGNFSGTRITGNAGGNRLTGTDYADLLAGGAGNDTLVGGAGNDTLAGGAGVDSMSGGTGNDLFVLGAAAELAGDVFSGGAGNDTLRIDVAAPGATINLGASVTGIEEIRFGAALANVAVNVSAAGAANGMVIFGTAGANVITGTSFQDVLIGGDGNDVFVINAAGDHAGDEFIEGGNGTDEVRFAGATGTLLLGAGFLGGDTGIERASVANGANTGIDASALGTALRITGGSGNNTLLGGGGDDTLLGTGGADSLNGGAGNDLYLYTAATESVAGETIADTGDQGDFDIVEYSGLSGVLVLQSQTTGVEVVQLAGTAATGINAALVAAPLDMRGNNAANVLTGGSGNDTINGGLGLDTLAGGAGNDRFTGTGAELSRDAINGGTGFDQIAVLGSAQATLGAISQVEAVQGLNINAASVISALSLQGDDALSSTLVGGAGADTLRGGAGADRLSGGGGNDRFDVDGQATIAGDTLDGGAGTDAVFFTHGAEDGLGAYLAQVGLPGGPALLLGMGGMSLAGIEEIRIVGADGTLDSAPASVIADGSLQGTLLVDGPSEFTFEQITDEAFIGDLLFAGSLDPLIEFVDGSLLSLSREEQLVQIMAVINADPIFALNAFNSFLSDLLQDQEIELGAYNASSVSGGLRIIGNDGANVIAGTRFTDRLAGNGGDDVFLVSSGAHHPLEESIEGGAGHDEVWFTSGQDGDTLVLGFADTGIDDVRIRTLTGESQAAANVDASRLGTAIVITGNDAANVLTGSRFADTLLGMYGDDLLQGGRGDDFLNGGGGNDALQGGLGNDLIINPHASLAEIDSVNGGAGTDTVWLDEGATFNMTLLEPRSFAGVEHIQFGEGTANTLIVTFDRILESVGDGGVLTIDGDADDRVQLAEEWTVGASAGGYVSWQFEDLDTGAHATLRVDEDIAVGRVFVAVDGADSLAGTPANDTFVFTQATLDEGDAAAGGDGFDVVELMGFGDFFDLGLLTLSGVEQIRLVDGGSVQLGGDSVNVLGSAFSDTILVAAADLPALIDGGEEFDVVNVHLGAAATLSGGTFLNVEQIALDGGGALTLDGFFQQFLAVQDDEDYSLVLDGAENVFINLGGGDDSIVAGTVLDQGSGSVDAGAGADTLDGVPLGVYSVQLGPDDDLYLFDAATTGRAVFGGDGLDTIFYDGEAAGTVWLGADGFEALDAGGATGSLIVIVDGLGGPIEITTGAGNDLISLAPWFTPETVHAGDGADTVSMTDTGDDVSLEGGDDTFNWDYNGVAGWTVDGGTGSDTLHIMSFTSGIAEQLTIDFSTAQNADGVVFNFENLDAGGIGADLQLFVHASGEGSAIVTGGADDLLDGAAGNDTLTGGLGADTFRIDTAPPADVDVLADFDPGSDFLALLDSAFAGISGESSLEPGQFALGTAAADADDFIVYDGSTGNLYYDADGDQGAGPVLFAVLSNQAALTADDILVLTA